MVDEAADVAHEDVPEEPRPSRLRLRLVGLSFLMLFLELALIRWAASNNVHLAYLTNFVLLASFLGIGIGFLRVRRSPDLFPFTPARAGGDGGVRRAVPGRPDEPRATLEGAFGMEPLPRWVTLTVLFVLTVAVMACIGQGVARAFVQFEALEAYRLDILGSIGGIVVFSVLAFLQLPPIVWGSIAAALLVVLLGWRPQLLGLLVVVVVLGIQSAAPDDQWSPYYKITAKHAETQMVGGIEARDTLTISANNIPHQTAYDVETLLHLQPFYAFPYRHLDAASLDRVLIVGAGNGNDVAVALAQGAKHIDAVEIDPVIQDLGERYHPSHPYQDPRVTVHIDDGRAFVERDDEPVRPDPVRPARLADPVRRPGQPAARELPLHHRVDDDGARAPRAGRDVRHVQLLRAVPARPVRHHAAGRLRHRAVRRGGRLAGRPRPGRPHRRRRRHGELRHAVGR